MALLCLEAAMLATYSECNTPTRGAEAVALGGTCARALGCRSALDYCRPCSGEGEAEVEGQTEGQGGKRRSWHGLDERDGAQWPSGYDGIFALCVPYLVGCAFHTVACIQVGCRII